jgi:hypothetical protein
MIEKNIPILLVLLVATLFATLSGCDKSHSDSATQSAPETSTQPTPQRSPLTQFESDLQYIRNGGYTYVWVFSRRDGKPLDKDDAAFLRKNAPQIVDWVTTDQGKKVIGGTNFDLEKGNLELLKKRFVTEDYSSK